MLNRMKNRFGKTWNIINRNNLSIEYNPIKVKNYRVNLQYCCREDNVGDILSPIVCEYLLKKKELNFDNKVSETKHLYAIGSIIDFGYQDATIWGSGIINEYSDFKLTKSKNINRKLDIRLVRGPETRRLLINAGYECPERYGDPAVLMPYIYNPEVEKKYKISYIPHINGKLDRTIVDSLDNVINMGTNDYEKVISEIKSSEKVISSSLHGIILAETYGVPAIFVAKDVKRQIFKFYDWYHSTNREEFSIASSFASAKKMEETELPKLSKMQETILETFPYDLWDL